jgi:hypothetical protein
MKVAIMTNGKKIQVGLDKIAIGLPYPSFPKADETPLPEDQIQLIHAKRKEFVAKLKHIENMITLGPHHCKATSKNLKRYHVLSEPESKHSDEFSSKPESDGSNLCIFSLGFAYGTAVINLEFNPGKLTPEQFEEIGALLSVMFDDHYQEVYDRGVVAHAEFFIDVPEEELSNLVLVDERRRSTTMYKGTSYSGKRASRLVGTMYNKAKQSKSAGKLVRVEVRINDRMIQFKDLVEQDLFNPFSSLLVVEASQLQLVAQEWKSPHLANNIKELGLYGGVSTSYARKAIKTYLKDHQVSWWQPDLIWAAHRKLLQKLKPGHAGVFG